MGKYFENVWNHFLLVLCNIHSRKVVDYNYIRKNRHNKGAFLFRECLFSVDSVKDNLSPE